jgi:hypothetical protein
MSNRLHGSTIDVFAHAAKETDVPYLAALIDKDFRDLDPVDTSHIDPSEDWLNVNGLLWNVGIAADSTGGRSLDVTGGRYANSRRCLRWRRRGLAGHQQERENKVPTTPQFLTHTDLDTELGSAGSRTEPGNQNRTSAPVNRWRPFVDSADRGD